MAAVSAVSTRQRIIGSDWTLLDSSEYELIDGTNGVLLISGWAIDGIVTKVSYTHTATAPPSTVALAATIIAASWMAPTLAPQTAGLESVAVGQNDANVKFRSDRGDVPSEAIRLLGARAIVIA